MRRQKKNNTCTSAKSRLINPGFTIRSVTLRTPANNTSSAILYNKDVKKNDKRDIYGGSNIEKKKREHTR